jgi:hypothetical protein
MLEVQIDRYGQGCVGPHRLCQGIVIIPCLSHSSCVLRELLLLEGGEWIRKRPDAGRPVGQYIAVA